MLKLLPAARVHGVYLLLTLCSDVLLLLNLPVPLMLLTYDTPNRIVTSALGAPGLNLLLRPTVLIIRLTLLSLGVTASLSTDNLLLAFRLVPGVLSVPFSALRKGRIRK
ncbi:MAG: hypothetical protein AB7P09_14845 [Pyrinomonadaceae bacterium]